MLIEVQKEGRSYIISQQDTGVFTYDENLTSALNQFYEAFIEQYEFLRSNEGHLSNSLSRELRTFRALMDTR